MLDPHSDFLSLSFPLNFSNCYSDTLHPNQTVKQLEFPGFSNSLVMGRHGNTAKLSDHSREPHAGAACISLKRSSTVQEQRMKKT